MREVADADRIRRFMRALGAEADRERRVLLSIRGPSGEPLKRSLAPPTD